MVSAVWFGVLFGCSSAHVAEPSEAAIAPDLEHACAIIHSVRETESPAFAFCVHPSGVFLTLADLRDKNEQSQFEFPDQVELELFDKTRKTTRYSAKVLKSFRLDGFQGNLSVLKVLQEKDEAPFPTISLSGTADLKNGQTGWLFGFAKETNGKETRPRIQSQKITIGAFDPPSGLTHELMGQSIRFGVAPSVMHKGCLLLQDNGELIGVVSNPRSFHIQTLKSLQYRLATPVVRFTPPEIDYEERHQPATFEAVAVDLLSEKPLQLFLELTDLTGNRIGKTELTSQDGVTFRGELVPMVSNRLPCTIQFPDGEINGSINSQETILINEKKLAFEAIREIRKVEDRIVVVTQDGRTLRGEVPNGKPLEVELHKSRLTADLTEVVKIEFPARQNLASIRYKVNVVQDKAEVYEENGAISIEPPFSTLKTRWELPVELKAFDGKVDEGNSSATLTESGALKLELPGQVTRVCYAGGGRYLLLTIRDKELAVVFDVNQRKLVKEIPLGSPYAFVAGSLEHFVIVKPMYRRIERWSLADFSKEASRSIPEDWGIVWTVAMGAGTQGPLILSTPQKPNPSVEGAANVIDLDTLELNRSLPQLTHTTQVHVSLTGEVITGTGPNSPSGIEALHLRPIKPRRFYEHDNAGMVLPSADGRRLSTSLGIRRFDSRLFGRPQGFNRNPVPPPETMETHPCIPTLHPRYYLALTHKATLTGTIRVYGYDQAIGVLPELPELPALGSSASRPTSMQVFAYEQIQLLPQADMLITIPKGKSALYLRRLDVEEKASQLMPPPFFVSSSAPTTTTPGHVFAHQFQTVGAKGAVKYRLVKGPSDLRLSPEGRLWWQVPLGFTSTFEDIIIEATDENDRKTTHSISVDIVPLRNE